MADKDPTNNPFVRWKKHVDDRIGAGLNSVLGLPSILSKTFSQPSPTNTDSSVSDQVQHLRPVHCPRVHEPINMRAFPLNLAAQSAFSDLTSTIHDPNYSPLALDEYLPPPVPRDVPEDVGLDPESDFTFRDAYEDLLRVSTGLPLTPFLTLAARKAPVYKIYGFERGESPYQWMGRISSDGLVRRVLEQAAQQQFVEHEDRERGMSERGEPFAALTKSWAETGNPFRSESANTFRRDPPAERDDGDDDLLGNVFTELDRAVSVMERVFNKATERQAGSTGPTDKARMRPNKMPDTETEMYEMLRDVFSGSASLRTLVRAAMGESRDENVPSWTSRSASSQTDNDPTGTRTVRTTEEHTDEDGTRHVTIVLQNLNAAGKEVSRETTHIIRSEPGSRLFVEEDGVANPGGKTSSQSAGTNSGEKTSHGSNKSGWFWK